MIFRLVRVQFSVKQAVFLVDPHHKVHSRGSQHLPITCMERSSLHQNLCHISPSHRDRGGQCRQTARRGYLMPLSQTMSVRFMRQQSLEFYDVLMMHCETETHDTSCVLHPYHEYLFCGPNEQPRLPTIFLAFWDDDTKC